MTVGARLRFEILKRDGFRCKYCGASSMDVLLHVDHVVPVAEGGADDPVNLVAACASCNLGKSDIPLEVSALTPPSPSELAREHAQQIREYLQAQREVEAAREEVYEYICLAWRDAFGSDPLVEFYKRLRILTREHPIDRILDAIIITASGNTSPRAWSQFKYFIVVLRNLKDKAARDVPSNVPGDKR